MTSPNTVYLDHAATTRPSDYLVSQMLPYFKRHWQCPSAPYLKGKEPFVSVNQKVRKISNGVGAGESDQFVFTSCSAEGIAQIYQGLYLDEIRENGKSHFVTTPIEDASILMGMKRFENLGIQTKIAPLNEQGILTAENLAGALSPRTGLVSISWANGLIGIIHPIAEIAELCRDRNILLHVDASDVLGKLTFRFKDLPIDFLTVDGDRLYAPKGTGALFIRHARSLGALIPDGAHQHGLRGGTLNLPGLIGLGIAFEELEEHFDHFCMEIPRLRDQLEEGIVNGFSDAQILFQTAARLPNVSVIAFPGVSRELLAFHLAQNNVFASLGGGRHQKLDALLIAAGVAPELARSALSFSLGRETSQDEIQRAIGIIVDAAAKCKTFSAKIEI